MNNLGLHNMNMNNGGRRDFLAKIGLLSGAMILGNRSYGSELGRAARFNLRPEMDAVHVYCTGNLNNRINFLTELPDAVQTENALWLSAGNFVHANGQYQATVAKMNQQGYQVAAIGENEWALGDRKLLKLAKECDFSLVKSHGKGYASDWQTWIKPYEIIWLGHRSVAVVAMGPSEGAEKDLQAWQETEAWAKKLKEDSGCDMVVCLMPQGYDKRFVEDCVGGSRSIDVINCAGLTEAKASNGIMKNANGHDVIVQVGHEQGNTIAKQVYSLERDGLVLPQQITHKELKSI
ncbi:hypothetical protein ORI89_11790 [Sphingobacterium sp. UT-1RO-CII-1]|uniref:hypothetical protein n=1 Tax=Sphingobacterium sp. UT-1RO-CII-1 TaxID=2995225 RepID=UPI00227B18B8|nr:hypothetical protein [Sphingobacterium sp. UT-1RO-CII-1]MCY4780335.1 hypothetical protein [Sphingobacterium sp. UT-1RO-CII-1]